MNAKHRLQRLEAAHRRRRGDDDRIPVYTLDDAGRRITGPLYGTDRQEIDVLGVAAGTQQPPAWWTRDGARETVRILQACGAIDYRLDLWMVAPDENQTTD